MDGVTSRGVLAIAVLVMSTLGCGISSLLGGPVLEDDFSNTDGGWGTKTDSTSSVEYSDGSLRLRIFTRNYFVWSTPNDADYGNVHIEVTAINNNTDPTTAFGVMCNQQAVTDSFYYFAVTPAGEYAIAKTALAQSDLFLTNNDQWASSDLIAQSASSYRIGADCGSGRLALYVDGQLVAEVSDSSYTNGGVALFTWSGERVDSADMSFDDFVMTELEQ